MNVLALLLLPTLLLNGDPPLTRLDRVVAVVDEDPILFSDLRRLVLLSSAAVPADDDLVAWRPWLERAIDLRVRAHEVDRYGLGPAPRAEVDAEMARLGGTLAGAGVDRAELRRFVELQLRLVAYIDERLGPRVFVEESEIKAYYDDTLRAEMAARAASLPPLAEVDEAIRNVLRERALNREIENWSNDLRQEASIRDLLDLPLDLDLPPLVHRSNKNVVRPH
jgi:hypothetical protein